MSTIKPPKTQITTNTSTHQLRAENIQCVRGERTLFSDLNLELNAGQCLHVIGANGSGKSSLLRILCGILQAESGVVFWDDKNIASNQIYLSNLAYIGHKDGLKNELSAAENLSFYQNLDSRQNDDLVDEYLARLGILRCADLLAQQLSFGQRRRLSFSRLLIKHFPLWVLDEPFTGIDQDGREVIEKLCVEHLEQGGMIILTNHQSLQNSDLKPFLTGLSLIENETAVML